MRSNVRFAISDYQDITWCMSVYQEVYVMMSSVHAGYPVLHFKVQVRVSSGVCQDIKYCYACQGIKYCMPRHLVIHVMVSSDACQGIN